MAVRRCGKCGSSWMSALTHCAFCGTEGQIEPEVSREPLKVHAAKPEPPPPAPEPAPEPVAAAVKVEEEPSPLPETDLLTAPAPLPGTSGEGRAVPPPPPPEPKAPTSNVAAPRIATARAPAAAVEEPVSKVPLILGLLSVLSCVAVPLAVRYEGHKLLGTAAIVACALFIPLAPWAWFLGQRTLDGFRAKGLRPPLGPRVGRMLGLLAAFVVTAEVGAVAALIVVCRFMGKLPSSFLGGGGNP